jgi:hypothetical protein
MKRQNSAKRPSLCPQFLAASSLSQLEINEMQTEISRPKSGLKSGLVYSLERDKKNTDRRFDAFTVEKGEGGSLSAGISDA